MDEIASLWKIHQAAAWPEGLGPHEGELMTLDKVAGGCVAYFLESDQGLDPARLEILEGCASDLESLIPQLEGEARTYFHRLQNLATALLNVSRSPS